MGRELAKDTIQKLQEEIERLTALQAYGVDELNKAEADAAVTRDALKTIRLIVRITCPDDCIGRIEQDDECVVDECAAGAVLSIVRQALSGEDGKELLERMWKLEAVAEAAKDVLADVEDWGIKVPDVIHRLSGTLAALDGEQDG